MSDIRKAVYLTVHEFPPRRGLNSVETAALVLQLAAGTVYNKASPSNDAQGLLIEEGIALINASGDLRILHAFNSCCDHVAVALGDYAKTSDLELLDLMLEQREAEGKLSEAIRLALEDGKVTRAELDTIRDHFHELIRRELELLSRLEGIAHG